MAGVLGRAKIPITTWVSSLVAVSGVALLSSDKGHGTVASLSGDALEVLSALFFSTYVFRLEKYCNTVAANPLVATKIAVQALLSIGWALFAEVGSNIVHAPSDSPEHVVSWTFNAIAINALVVGWTGLVSSALSGWAQTKGQQGVPASEAVVIFATQPLWASALAAVLLGESFGPRGLAGGALIIAATLIASRKQQEKSSDEKQA
ncbi:EamA-like transporter [Gracilaria domingensis]|nr:EamA-like transporter [Gracilaria domingensis]